MATGISQQPEAVVPACPRRRGKTGLRKLSKATQAQLFISSALAVVIISLVLLMPNLTIVQQFYLRIIIGLAAASIAALIPGFFEIELNWLRNTLRAGGAIGIFLLIYGFNPPAIEQFDTLKELEGHYEYECTKRDEKFLHGGFQHGGNARIQIVRTRFGYALSISGDRQWTRKDKDSERVPVDNPSTWQTHSCNFTGDDRLIYEYITTEKGANYLGISTLKIVKDDSGNIFLEGAFQRLAPDQNTYGTVIMRKKR
jgi:hypothetical protein